MAQEKEGRVWDDRHLRDYERSDFLLPVFFKRSFLYLLKLNLSQGPGNLIRIQSLLSAERQFTHGTSSDILLLIHLKGTKGEQQSLVFACCPFMVSFCPGYFPERFTRVPMERSL
jgi:hypothetical protein